MDKRKITSSSPPEVSEHKHILMVDDNPADLRLVDEALAMSGLKAQLHMVENAVLAYSYLSKQGRFANARTPDLILLDVSMPVIHGTKVLEIIKKERDWSLIPVFVLSSSTRREDVDACYKMGADVYIVKPIVFDNYVRLVRAIGAFLAEKKPIGTESALHILAPGKAS